MPLLGAPTQDPLGGLLRTNYNAGDQRWAGIMEALGAASESLLNPRQNSAGGWASDIGAIGTAMNKAGTAYEGGKSTYLATALAKEQAQRKLEDDEAQRAAAATAAEREAANDQALADLIGGLSPEERAWAKANPTEWYKQAVEQRYSTSVGSRRPTSLQEYDEAVRQGYKGTWMEYDALQQKKAAAGAKVPDYSTTPRSGFDQSLNGGKGGYREFQLADDGSMKEVIYPPGVEPVGPGEATVRGSKFKDYAKQQDAAYTSVTNIAQASTDIANLREAVAASPELTTSWGGRALKDLPGTAANDVRARLEQIEAGAFFSSIQEMQGYGALSNAEGQRVAQAKSRVNQSLSYEDLITALDDYERVIDEVYERNSRIIDTGDWDEMNRIRQENAKGLTFKKSRVPPFPGDQFMTKGNWDAFSADDKRAFYDAQKLVY